MPDDALRCCCPVAVRIAAGAAAFIDAGFAGFVAGCTPYPLDTTADGGAERGLAFGTSAAPMPLPVRGATPMRAGPTPESERPAPIPRFIGGAADAFRGCRFAPACVRAHARVRACVRVCVRGHGWFRCRGFGARLNAVEILLPFLDKVLRAAPTPPKTHRRIFHIPNTHMSLRLFLAHVHKKNVQARD